MFPLAVKEGDRVLFGKYSGTEIKIDGEDFVIMREEEVLGILSGVHGQERDRRNRKKVADVMVPSDVSLSEGVSSTT